MAYSVIRFEGSMQTVLDEKLSLTDATQRARRDIASSEYRANQITAVVNDDTDTVVWDHVYQNGRQVSRRLVDSIVYGLGRFM